MASNQFVYHMNEVSKTYPGGKKVFENIRLNFLPGVKIGVVGVNGAGKSTLLRLMAGLDKDFQGEAWAAEGARVGYLSQEPQLDDQLNVRGNVMEGVRAKQAILDRYNELAMDYSDETADEMAALRTRSTRRTCGTSTPRSDIAMEALRCPPTTPTCPPSRAASAAASRSASSSSRRPTCSSSTSPPTTSTPRPSPGSRTT
jgi:ATPase subunit of ABC transporter with duplicated ATPase domains